MIIIKIIMNIVAETISILLCFPISKLIILCFITLLTQILRSRSVSELFLSGIFPIKPSNVPLWKDISEILLLEFDNDNGFFDYKIEILDR